jgi:hypothetical protein
MLGDRVVSKTVGIPMCTNFVKHIDNLLVQLVGPTSIVLIKQDFYFQKQIIFIYVGHSIL